MMELERLSPRQTLSLDRQGFNRAVSHLVEEIQQTVSVLLKDAGIPAGAIDTVFFTGGSSGVPLLRDKVAALLPLAKRAEGDLFGSIGTGLALDAMRRFR
jgi:hypothetical chaperone protein